MNFVASLVIANRINFTQKLNIIIWAYHIFLYLWSYLLNTFMGWQCYVLLYYCWVFLFFALLVRNYTVIISILFCHFFVEWLKYGVHIDCISFQGSDTWWDESFNIFYLSLYLFCRNEFKSQSYQVFRVFYYFVIKFSQLNVCEIGYSHLKLFLFLIIFFEIWIGFKR